MPPVVFLHDVFTVEHLVADLTGVQLLTVLLLMLGQVAVGGEEARADVTLEGLVICGEDAMRVSTTSVSHTHTHSKVWTPICFFIFMPL